MMTSRSLNIRTACLLSMMGLMLFTACSRTLPVKYYTLHPAPAAAVAETLPPDMAIVVGPVMIPAALDRQLIVTRNAKNNVHLSEYHRWAGPLQKNIAAVLAQNLGTRLGSERVTAYTAEDIFQPTHRIVVSIIRFDGGLEKDFVLDAIWSLKTIGSVAPLEIRRTTIIEPLASPDYNGLVAAQSKALAALSEKMVAAIVEFTGKNAG